MKRPAGVAALSIFFVLSAAVSFASAVSLAWPGGPLEPMWRLNPRAHAAFASMGPWALAMLAAVCAACGAAATGLWRGRRWGHRLALVVLGVNLLGDIGNVAFGKELRALLGVPIVGALLAYLLLSPRVRAFFASARRA